MAVGKRFIDGDKLLERIADKILRKHTGEWLKRQPRSPALVSRQGAAGILGIQTPHLRRVEDRLPEAISVEGTSWPFYLKADIEELAKTIKAEKAKKKKK